MSNKSNDSKFDFTRIIDNIRQVIPSQFSTPEPVSGDQLGESLKRLSELASDAAKQHAELTQKMYELESGINELFVHIDQLRGQGGTSSKEAPNPQSTAYHTESNNNQEQTPPDDSTPRDV